MDGLSAFPHFFHKLLSGFDPGFCLFIAVLLIVRRLQANFPFAKGQVGFEAGLGAHDTFDRQRGKSPPTPLFQRGEFSRLGETSSVRLMLIDALLPRHPPRQVQLI
jgi:hypothetical protein